MELKGGEALEKALAKIADGLESGGSLKVGILEGATYPDGMPVAQVGFWNEFGTVNAPPRPFFRTAIENNNSEWASVLARAVVYYDYNAKQALGALGVKMAEDVTQSIVGWQSPENAPYTVKKKGFNKPLIETGDLSRSIDSEVSDA